MKKKIRYVQVDRIYSLRRERLGPPKQMIISELESWHVGIELCNRNGERTCSSCEKYLSQKIISY